MTSMSMLHQVKIRITSYGFNQSQNYTEFSGFIQILTSYT